MLRFVLIVCTLAACVVTPVAKAQKVDAYIHDMEKALVPLGLVDASSCHKVQIHSPSTLGLYVLTTGQDEQGEPRFSVYAADAIEIDVDLADLNEDKVSANMVISGANLSKHQKGTPWVRDKTAVLIPASSPRRQVTVHAIDAVKLEAQRAQGNNNQSESNLDVKVEQRVSAVLLFSSEQNADAFVSALKKAIVVCKAQ